MIRGKYNLLPREKEYVNGLVKGVIKTLDDEINDEVNLSSCDIAPCHICDAMEVFGWEQDESDSNGWENDTWYYFAHPDYKYVIVMFYCGYTFELKMYRGDKDV
jgi:hypothetical protein